MLLKRFGWICLGLLLLAFSAKADTVTVYVDGTYAFANNGVAIPPYGGTIDGQPASFYCVDFDHEISGGTSWTATVTPLGPTTDYSSTRLNNGTEYQEIAWLLDQSLGTTDQTTQAQLQWAVWSFSGGSDPYGTNSNLLTEAANAVSGGFTANNWEILTPTGQYGQEFFVATPEPSSLAMLAGGLIGLITLGRRKLFC